MIDILKNFKLKIVPLLFGIFIVVSFMYIYDTNLTLVFLLCSVMIQGLFYLFYDYISTKGKVLQYISIIGSLVAMIFILISIGSLYSYGDIWEFALWFLSPQGAMGYSLQYIFVMLVGLNFFISSTVYYFTQIRYRMLTTFLLFLLPFAMFAKENIQIPTIFLLLLIILYFATMIICGQNNMFRQRNLKVLENKSYIKSIGAFVLSFMLVISSIPKPEIVADREVFENLISASTLTGFLLAQLGNFTDTSNGTGTSFMTSNRKLFSVECSETVALKSRTFSNYNFNKNVWLRSDGVKSLVEDFPEDINLYYNGNESSLINYDMKGLLLRDNSINDFQELLNPAKFMNAILFACKSNQDFANKYNLTSALNMTKFNTNIKSVSVENKNFSTSFILNPTRTFEIASLSYSDNLQLISSYSGIVSDSNGLSLSNYSKYTVNYYSSNEILRSSDALEILRNLNFDTYQDFLNDLSSIADGTEYDEVIQAYIEDYKNSLIYSKVFTDCNSEKISKLAEDITNDCNSDIEKTFALENYFISNGYIYDANYQAGDSDTIETFIFSNKTGACYEYSTSMILMARALGLPARYVEGFLAVNSTGTNQKIDITAQNAHAYPEIFISGYGWCYFEPTQTFAIAEQDIQSNTSQNLKLFIVSLIMVIGTSIISIFVVFIYPKIYENNFRKRVSTKDTKEALTLIILRIRKLSKLSNTQTLEETKQSILDRYHIDITDIVEVSNNAFYGNDTSLNSKDTKLCLDKYILLYNSIIELNKQQKKLHQKGLRKSKY